MDWCRRYLFHMDVSIRRFQTAMAAAHTIPGVSPQAMLLAVVLHQQHPVAPICEFPFRSSMGFQVLYECTWLTSYSMPIRQNSGSSTPRTRPPATTLNIPGMTRSRVSPDGRIAERDVASKLVIIMVGLPARGKSYITKKIQRYLSWQQHNSQIFNVGNRRRVAASAQSGSSNTAAQAQPRTKAVTNTDTRPGTATDSDTMDGPTQAAHILLNGVEPSQNQESATRDHSEEPPQRTAPIEPLDQTAEFFDPSNARASQVREQVAISTLDELLDYLLLQGGSAGILDATNSTIERRKMLFNRVKERDSKLGILFIESICEDQGVGTSSLVINLMLTILL